MNKKEYIEELEQTIIRLSDELTATQQRLLEANEKITHLEKRLVKYENPHTPSSQRPFSPPPSKEISKEPKKRGAPVGHKGATRPTPVPTQVIPVKADHCERCGSNYIKVTDEFTGTIIEDLPPPGKIEVTQYDRYKVNCYECGHSFFSKDENCPREGNFGVFLLLHMAMLKYHLRGPLRKVQDYLSHAHLFDISPKGILDSLLRVGNACQTEYQRTIERIRASQWCHIDETSIRVNVKKWWIWVFRSDQNDVLVVIRPSRGSKVVKEILGEDWNKPIIVDGWKAYNYLGILQRCWSHLLREIDALKDDSESGSQLSTKVHSLFDSMKLFLESNPSMDLRVAQKEKWDNEIAELVEAYKGIEDVRKPITYMRNGMGSWFTCVLYPGMEPTNNLAEQTIREQVIYRKIIGAFRSESGSQNHQYIASLLPSWKLQGKNMWVELEALLRKELCLS